MRSHAGVLTVSPPRERRIEHVGGIGRRHRRRRGPATSRRAAAVAGRTRRARAGCAARSLTDASSISASRRTDVARSSHVRMERGARIRDRADERLGGDVAMHGDAAARVLVIRSSSRGRRRRRCARMRPDWSARADPNTTSVPAATSGSLCRHVCSCSAHEDDDHFGICNDRRGAATSKPSAQARAQHGVSGRGRSSRCCRRARSASA